MSRVDLSGERVDEIILNENDVPGVDEVDGGIVPDLEVTIQSEEPLEGTVDRVVEGNGIETIEGGRSKEILAVVGGDVRRFADAAFGCLVWSSTASAEESKLSICAAPRT